MYIAAGQGQTTPGDKILMSTETSCHFAHLLPISKKSLWKSDFIHFFFMILYMYIVLGQGLTTPWGWNFSVNRNILSLRSFVANLKKISLKSDFIQFFSWFYTCIAPGQRQTSPRGQCFDVNRNVLSLHSFVASFKNMSLKSDFIPFLYDLRYVYSTGVGADSPQGTKFWCQQKGLIPLPICCKFQRYNFFSWFNTCI